MLGKLQMWAQEGALTITHAYFGHLKRDGERKILAHADAGKWDSLDPKLRELFERFLLQALAGAPGELNFPAYYVGEVLPVDRVAGGAFDRAMNRPAVEVLEALRDLPDPDPGAMIPLGNALAYKVMAAGTIKNHLLGVLKFSVVPELGARPVAFVFAALCDLEDREESFFDESRGMVQTQQLANVVRQSRVARAVFFPCLDEQGRECADLLVYAASGSGTWFRALEATLRLPPRKEGRALVRLITEQNADGEVPHDLFRRMGENLLPLAADGLDVEAVADSLEEAVGHGIDRAGLRMKWQAAFGDAGYRPSYAALFGEAPTPLKMQAGEIVLTVLPQHLEHFRQVSVNGETFIVFRVPERAKVVVGKDLDLRIAPVDLEHLQRWMLGHRSNRKEEARSGGGTVS